MREARALDLGAVRARRAGSEQSGAHEGEKSSQNQEKVAHAPINAWAAPPAQLIAATSPPAI
jgi:hypothetical protein